ncbi:MAG: hypothetical protein PHS62_02310 [Patescibacteria group bacterium]|nr:hypothetical protein [Patescibacteria group bacterium]
MANKKGDVSIAQRSARDFSPFSGTAYAPTSHPLRVSRYSYLLLGSFENQSDSIGARERPNHGGNKTLLPYNGPL